MELDGVGAVLDHPMSRARREDEAHRDEQERERHDAQRPRGLGQPIERFLEERTKLKSEQDLNTEDEHARLVHRVLHFVLERHAFTSCKPSALQLTRTGVLREIVVPSPSWPKSFHPQHQIEASLVRAHTDLTRVVPSPADEASILRDRTRVKPEHRDVHRGWRTDHLGRCGARGRRSVAEHSERAVSPARDVSVRENGACALVSGGNLDDRPGDSVHRDRRFHGCDDLTVAELAVCVRSPTARGSIIHDDAGVVAAHRHLRDAGKPELIDRHWRWLGQLRIGFTFDVGSPTPHASIGEDRTGVASARAGTDVERGAARDLGDRLRLMRTGRARDFPPVPSSSWRLVPRHHVPMPAIAHVCALPTVRATGGSMNGSF